MAFTWGNIVNDYGRIGFDITVTTTSTTAYVTIDGYFWSKYGVEDVNNSWYYDNNSSSASTYIDSIPINHTVNSGAGWSTSNRTNIGTISYEYARSTSNRTIYCSGKLSGVDTVGSSMYVTASYVIPAIGKYTVAYSANGGTGAPTSQSKTDGVALTLSSVKPTRTGYTFIGWNTSSTATTATYSAGATYTEDASIVLYAVWRANTFTVSYNANGGTGAPTSQTKTYDVALTLSSTKPTRSGYTFAGWGVSSSSTTVTYASGANYTDNTSVTLYAIWTIEYAAPTISNVTLTRCSNSGVAADNGTYFKIEFGWETYKTISSITIRWKVSTSTTWSTSSVSASGVSGSVSKILGSGSISSESTYDVEIVVTDGTNTSTVSRILPGTAYLIDFLNGGGGVAIGKPAETKNLFDVYWAARMRNSLTVDGSVSAESISSDGSVVGLSAEFDNVDVSTILNASTANIDTLYDSYDRKVMNGLTLYESDGIDPNTTLDHLILTHINTPNGGFMYIKTEFYSVKSTTANRMQTAFPYNSAGSPFFRYYSSGSWSKWFKFDTAIKAGDTYTVPNGSQICGIISGSGAIVQGTLYLGVPIVATSITLSGSFVVRGGSGYLNSMSYLTGVSVSASGYTCSASIVDANRGVINIRFQKSSAFSNVTNNTPVAITSAENTPLVLRFS